MRYLEDSTIVLVPVLIAVLAHLGTKNEWKGAFLSGLALALITAAVMSAFRGAGVLPGAAKGLLAVFALGCASGAIVAIPFALWRRRAKKGPPPGSGESAQPGNNELERTAENRDAPLRREMALWPALQLGR